MPRFTYDQRKAHDAARHTAIEANAGSGKTRVLVSRYCDLVEGAGGAPVSPTRIAAITFTEKAAAELRERIADELNRRLQEEEHRRFWERLERAREAFTNASVATIHSFCMGLLRLFPVESGLSANFGVADAFEQHTWRTEAVQEAIEEAMEPRADGTASDAYDAARRLGRENLEAIIAMTMANREAVWFSEQEGVLRLGRAETLALWRSELERVVLRVLRAPAVFSAASGLIPYMKDEAATALALALERLRECETSEECLDVWSAVAAATMTKKGEPLKRAFAVARGAFAGIENEIAAEVAVLSATNTRIAPFIEVRFDPMVETRLYKDVEVVRGIHARAVEGYRRRMARANVLDYDDLQLRLLEVLRSNPEARAAMASEFDHIMIDEFQDTNEVQYAIARLLADDLRGPSRLCIVGDTKQSIYGFRGAEVAVFGSAAEAMREANIVSGAFLQPLRHGAELLGGSEEERSGRIVLSASFRLLPSICAYVNSVCSPLLREGDPFGYGVGYQPLVCARGGEGRGAVEVLLATLPSKHDEGAAGTGAETACAEPMCEEEVIARRIAALVDSGETVWKEVRTPEGGVERRAVAVGYGDIAVLCRKRKHFTLLEHELRRLGVPSTLHGGSGFYGTQEVYDLLNYLRVLDDPGDSRSLLGVLRSPFFGVSDLELYRTRQVEMEPAATLWDRMERRVASADADPSLRRAAAMLREDRAVAGRLQIALLIRRIVERTGWRGAVIGTRRGEQARANIDKMIESARAFDERGFTSLHDFVVRVEQMVDLEQGEAEAPLNTGRSAVTIMTMHAAKGLEYPVVVLPRLNEFSRVSGAPYFDKGLGLGWDWNHNGTEYRPAITRLMALRRAERERAEEARLFYVALTRAKDRLILSGSIEEGKGVPEGSMLAWGLAPLGELPGWNATVPLRTRRLDFLEDDGVTLASREWEQEVAVRWEVEEVERRESGAEPYRIDARNMMLGTLPARAQGEIYSATQFATYTNCPTRFYLQYRLGIPESIASAYNADEERADTDEGTRFARIFRHAAASLDELAGDRSPDLLASIVREVLVPEPLLPAEETRFAERLTETLRRLLDTPAAVQVLRPPGAAAFCNHSMLAPLHSEFVRGVIDRVVEGPDGTRSFVQYKTRRLSADRVQEAAEASMAQVRLYAWLVGRSVPDHAGVEGTVLFTEHPDLPQTFSFSPFELRRVEDDALRMVEDIRALSYTGRRSLPTQTSHCPHCPYFIDSLCLLERSKRVRPASSTPVRR